MLSAGIVDPAKVVRVALQDAASVVGLMITTEAMVAEAPKKKEAPAMPGGGMGGLDYRLGKILNPGAATMRSPRGRLKTASPLGRPPPAART